jgi:hypothetical protein
MFLEQYKSISYTCTHQFLVISIGKSHDTFLINMLIYYIFIHIIMFSFTYMVICNNN